MRWIFVLLVMFVVFPVQAADVSMDVNKATVGISVGFNGEVLTVFGANPAGRQVAVVVEGPQRDVVVRKKSRVFGAWMNTGAVDFKEVPLFYDYALLEGAEDRFSYQPNVEIAADFRAAFLRNKQDLGHYMAGHKDVRTYPDTGLFRVDFALPSNVPVGEYVISLYEDDVVEPVVVKSVMVSQAGGNAVIKVAAREYSFLYGAVCVLFAMFMGWFSNRVRRRT